MTTRSMIEDDCGEAETVAAGRREFLDRRLAGAAAVFKSGTSYLLVGSMGLELSGA
jgi:hypothetical protein